MSPRMEHMSTRISIVCTTVVTPEGGAERQRVRWACEGGAEVVATAVDEATWQWQSGR